MGNNNSAPRRRTMMDAEQRVVIHDMRLRLLTVCSEILIVLGRIDGPETNILIDKIDELINIISHNNFISMSSRDALYSY